MIKLARPLQDCLLARFSLPPSTLMPLVPRVLRSRRRRLRQDSVLVVEFHHRGRKPPPQLPSKSPRSITRRLPARAYHSELSRELSKGVETDVRLLPTSNDVEARRSRIAPQ